MKNLFSPYLKSVGGNGLEGIETLQTRGRILEVNGTLVRSTVPDVSVGDLCYLQTKGREKMLAEVVGLMDGVASLSPFGAIRGISANTEVIKADEAQSISACDGMLGRVLDCMANPLDLEEKGPLDSRERYPVHSNPPEALMRTPIHEVLNLGVKAVDGFVTCGVGQRLGIYAAAGVGKSTLLAMFARNAEVDVTVLVLIGERGREVKEFIEDQLGADAMKNTVVVVATSDKPAMMRVRAAFVGTAIAEYFRDRGKRVLLLMDSVTRFARAQREIGLAMGELPTRRGYPSSVFSLLPQLFERVGASGGGSITALYTVLVEGDDLNEPVSDETRSLLDGHIILSRKLSQAGVFPAIDVPASLSRVMDSLATERHKRWARNLRELLVKYEEVEFLLKMGEYEAGSDPVADEAIKKRDVLQALLRQDLNENVPLSDTLEMMEGIST